MNVSMLKKELSENLYDSKGIWMIVAVSLIFSTLCVLATTIKEVTAYSQTDILQYALKSEALLILLVCMTLGAACFVSERENNTLESLLLTPVSKLSLTISKYLGVLIVGVILMLTAAPYILAISAGSDLSIKALALCFGPIMLLLMAFTAVSVILSVLMENSKVSVLISALCLAMLAIPSFMSSIFKTSSLGRLVLRIDPIVCAFELFKQVLTATFSAASIIQNLLPMVLFAVCATTAMLIFSRQISLKGEK